MKSDQPSRTALAACAVRALESLLPEDKRLFVEPYAAAFLEPSHRLLLGLCKASPWIRNGVERLLDRRFPGVPADFICRTRYIDELLSSGLRSGPFERIVLLGAGYDMRSFRIRIAGAAEPRIIEVDHPATQERKMRIVRGLVSNVEFERIAWVRHDLTIPLSSSEAFRASMGEPARSFWIAEGLLSYLPRPAVRKILEAMVSFSAPGSEAVFTYAGRDLVERRASDAASREIWRYLDERGEPFLSGWTPDEMARDCFLAGLEMREDLSETELCRRYLVPLGRTLGAVMGFRIATAQVAGQE